MAATADPTVIHQAVHGYDEGHRLLTSSRPLPREAERAMLILSDAAGPGMPDGFESYLTAYPLRAVGLFAFARTWAAPELPRPGCVWTHSLVVDVADIARFYSAATLDTLFRRPSFPPEGYDQPIHVSMPAAQPPRLAKRALETAAQVVEALYANEASGPVVVPAACSADAEALFLALWDQQWGELRSAFAFSTGSLAPRSLDGVPLWLQATPQADARRVWRRSAATVVGFGTPPQHKSQPEWTRAAADALELPAAPLTQFVRTVGRNLPADHAYFRPLVEAYLTCNRLTGSPLIRSLIAMTASTFPAANSGIAFKVALFDGPAGVARTHVLAADDDIVPTLAESEWSDAFPPDALHVEARSETWWANSNDYALVARVIGGPTNPLRDAFITGVARAVTVTDIQQFAAEHRPADAMVAARRPDCASRPELWRGPPSVQARLARVICDSPDAFGNLTFVVRAALAAHSDAAAPALSEAAGEGVVPAVMDWLAATGDIEGIGPRWRETLVGDPDRVMAWLSASEEPGPWSVWLAADILRPDASAVRRAGVGPWLRHLDKASDLPAWARCRIDSFLLGLGLGAPGDDTFAGVLAAFGRVYLAAKDRSLDDRNWGFVSHLLPEASWWREWDRCERLRRGIVDRFLSRKWSVVRLFDLLGEDSVSRDLEAEFRESRDGRRFLRGVFEAIEDGTLTVPANRGPRRRW